MTCRTMKGCQGYFARQFIPQKYQHSIMQSVLQIGYEWQEFAAITAQNK